MKKILRHSISLMVLCVGLAHAQPPNQVLYQGRLFDNVGNPVNGSANFAVSLFTQQSGGSSIWQQTINGVSVDDGIYSFLFGDAALSDALTNAACWLELSVAGETHEPRQRLVSVPYALRAGSASRLTVELSGVPAGVVIMWSGTLASIPSGWALCDGSNGTPDMRSRFVAGAPNAGAMNTVVGANSLVLSSNQLPAHTHSGQLESAGAHTHTASSSSAGAHTHGGGGISNGGAHTHSLTFGGYGDARGRPGGQYGSYPQFAVSFYNGGSHTHSYSTQNTGAHTHPVTVNSAGAHTHTVTLSATGGQTAIDNRPAFFELAYLMKVD